MTWAIREKDYSQRRACVVVGLLHPKTYRFASKRTGDAELRARLRELASQRRRFGYRRLGLLLARQGIRLNHKKLYRLYKEERLFVRRRGGRKRALGTRATMAVPQDWNLRWSLDFVMDTLVSVLNLSVRPATPSKAKAGSPAFSSISSRVVSHSIWRSSPDR